MSSFQTFNGSCKFACFLIFGAKNHSYLQSAWSKIIFPDFSKIIFSLTFPWQHKFPDIFQFFLTCKNPKNWTSKALQMSDFPITQPNESPCIYSNRKLDQYKCTNTGILVQFILHCYDVNGKGKRQENIVCWNAATGPKSLCLSVSLTCINFGNWFCFCNKKKECVCVPK